MDVVGSWPTNLVLLFAVVSKGIVGVNVLSRCTTDAHGGITMQYLVQTLSLSMGLFPYMV